MLTIGAQLDEHLAHIGVNSRAARRARAVAALDAVHLRDPEALLRRYPHQLSGGMCQRVLIAMAFASRPRLVVADEPTTALDVTVQARIVALMRELQQRDATAVLFITHDLRLAAQVCDEVAVLYAGAVVEQGPARRVFGLPAHPYTRCLQLANPSMKGPRRALYALPEQMPGLRALAAMDGCRFAPRCPIVQPAAWSAPPLPGGEHKAALLSQRVDRTIDVTDTPRAPVHPRQRTAASGSRWPEQAFCERGRAVRGRRRCAVRDVSFSLTPGRICRRRRRERQRQDARSAAC